MSRLDEIRERLYGKTFEERSPQRVSFLRSLRRERASPPPEQWSLENGVPPIKPSDSPMIRRKRWSVLTWVGIGGVILVLAGGYVGYRLFLVPDDVRFEIVGSSQAVAGEPTVFTIRIVNDGNTALTEGILSLAFPDGTILFEQSEIAGGPLRDRIEVPVIAPGDEYVFEVRGKLVGFLGEVKRVTGVLTYRPENVQSKFTRRAEFLTSIVRVPIAVAVDAPEQIRSGQEAVITISIDSELSGPLPDMAAFIDFPPGFVFHSSDPAADPDHQNRWSLGSFERGTSRKIVLRGTISGDPEQVHAFRVRVGRYQRSSELFLVMAETASGPKIASPLLLAQASLGERRSGSFPPGVQVSGSIFFKNNYTEKIRNIRIALALPETLVNLATIRTERGFYDVTRHALVWNASSEPRLEELDPGEEGKLSFSFDIKSTLPIQRFTDTNFTIPITTTIESLTPPQSLAGISLEYRDAVTFKIESPVGLAARVLYYGTAVPNSGPLPPQVRKTTTYTVTLQLSSGANDLRNVAVRARLGGGVSFLRDVGTDIGTLVFNEGNQEVLWRVTELPAATGILRPLATASFQISFTPAENQVGDAPVLVREISASAHDVFTDTEQQDRVSDLTIELRSDPRSNTAEWRVVP